MCFPNPTHVLRMLAPLGTSMAVTGTSKIQPCFCSVCLVPFFRSPVLVHHHRYIFELENILREVDCRVTVPYWDWSLWSQDPWSLNLPSLWHASMRGFGGNGSPPGGCVNTGPFREAVWSTTTGVCLRRNFNGLVPDAAQVQLGINMADFSSFEAFLRINLHNTVHCRIGEYGFLRMEFERWPWDGKQIVGSISLVQTPVRLQDVVAKNHS